MTMRVLIADDHAVTRRGLRDILGEAFPGLEVGEAADANAVVSMVDGGTWSLVLLDMSMPGGTVLEVLARVRAIDKTTPILILTASTELEYVVQTLRAGANGFIHKHRACDELVTAIKQVSAGSSYLDPESASALATAVATEKSSQAHEKLSGRELEIFRMIAVGRTVKEVAGDLNLSDKTVATYLSRIREKTGLSRHVDIARYALQHRLVDLPHPQR